MSTSTVLLRTLQEQVRLVDERVPGYRAKLMEALATIVAAEKSHQLRKTNVAEQVADQCKTLGELVVRGGSR